jgi:hypothetical protein
MKALAIHQPWAWLIAAGHKRIENRSWRTNFRGPLLIHATLKLDVAGFDLATFMLRQTNPGITIERARLQLGGIVGRVELVDIVTHSDSPWFSGPLGWVLCGAQVLPFRRIRGRQNLFDVPME